MDIALVSGNPHLPQLVGGVEINTHELAQELIRHGHRATVVAKLSLRNPFGWQRAARGLAGTGPLTKDCGLGYPVYRARRPWEIVSRLPRFTVAVIQNGRMLDLAAGFARIGVPSVAYLHGLEFEEWATPPHHPPFPFRGYIANSQYTATRLSRRYGLEATVIPPIFRRERYATVPTGHGVTFINPVAVKGVDLALEIAAHCPEIPFTFVRAWPLGFTELRRLRQRIARLGNVRLRRRAVDMRAIYRDTRILLVPSRWEAETWGRVVSEAQFSGIPALATDSGGLPEAVGPGGVLLGVDRPAEVWAERLRRLWHDDVAYGRLAEAARCHAQRPKLDPEQLVAAFIAALERVVN